LREQQVHALLGVLERARDIEAQGVRAAPDRHQQRLHHLQALGEVGDAFLHEFGDRGGKAAPATPGALCP